MMTHHNGHRTGCRLAGATVLFLCSVPVVCRGDTIYALQAGAVCRDSSGAVFQPRVSPPATPFPAEKTPLGMIMASSKINGKDCYFYMSEVGLTSPQDLGADACPDAAIAGDRSTLVGTRSIGRSNCR
jgi:hypothetical protein